MKVVFEITPEVHPNLAGEVLLHTFDPRWNVFEEGFLVEAHKQEVSVEDEDFLGDIFTVVDNDVLKWRLPTLRLYVFFHWDEADECQEIVIKHMDEGWWLFNKNLESRDTWGWLDDEWMGYLMGEIREAKD